jgi:hypothetical protein
LASANKLSASSIAPSMAPPPPPLLLPLLLLPAVPAVSCTELAVDVPTTLVQTSV